MLVDEPFGLAEDMFGSPHPEPEHPVHLDSRSAPTAAASTPRTAFVAAGRVAAVGSATPVAAS